MIGHAADVQPVGLVLSAAVLEVDRLVRLRPVGVVARRQVDAERALGAVRKGGQTRDRHVAPGALRRVGARVRDHALCQRPVVLLRGVVGHVHRVERAPGVSGETVGSVDRRVGRVGHPQVRVVVHVEPVLIRTGRQGHVGHPVAASGVRHLNVVGATAAHESRLVLEGTVDLRVGAILPVAQHDVGDEADARGSGVVVDEVAGVAGRRGGIGDDGGSGREVGLVRPRSDRRHGQCQSEHERSRGHRRQGAQAPSRAGTLFPVTQVYVGHRSSSLNRVSTRRNRRVRSKGSDGLRRCKEKTYDDVNARQRLSREGLESSLR